MSFSIQKTVGELELEIEKLYFQLDAADSTISELDIKRVGLEVEVLQLRRCYRRSVVYAHVCHEKVDRRESALNRLKAYVFASDQCRDLCDFCRGDFVVPHPFNLELPLRYLDY